MTPACSPKEDLPIKYFREQPKARYLGRCPSRFGSCNSWLDQHFFSVDRERDILYLLGSINFVFFIIKNKDCFFLFLVLNVRSTFVCFYFLSLCESEEAVKL